MQVIPTVILRRIVSSCVVMSWLLVGAASLSAASADKRSFDVPADRAEVSLATFSRQAGIEVLFSSDAAKDVRTNAVKGDFTPLDAARQILAGTPLYVSDNRDGVLLIARSSDPNGDRAGRTPNPARPDAPATARSTQTADGNETILMSPFRVSSATDSGYRATDVVTGTKIATPLNESPLTVGVVNKELLEDIGLTRVSEAIAFTQAGVANMGRIYYDQEQFTFRGYSGAILRNGIPFNAWTDSSNIERIEVARGPSAILYGFVSPGGVVNYVTKVPFNSTSAFVRARWSDQYGMREEWDLNTPIVANKVLFRLTGARSDGDTWIRYQTLHDTVLTPVVAINLTPDTTLTYEFSYHHKTGPFERIRFYYLPKADGFNSVILAPYDAALGGTVGYDINPGIAPWTWSVYDRHRSEARLEHRFDEHFRFLAVANDDHSSTESLTEFSNFTAKRDLGYKNVLIPPADHILLGLMPVYEHVQSYTQYAEANLLAQFETTAFKSNTLLGMSVTRQPKSYGPNGDLAPVPSLIGSVDYTLASPYTVRVSDPLSRRYYLPGTDYHTWPLFNPVGTVTNWGRPDVFVTESLSTLKNRLHVLAGVRREQYKALQIDRTLPQVGAIYEVVKGVSVYGIWSKTAEDNGRTKRYNTPRPLSESKAWDAGLKFDFLDSKLTGTVAYFDIKKTNLAINDPRLTVDYAQGLVDDTVTFTPGSSSKGVELSVQYQPARNLQAILSYAHTKANVLPGDPNPATWNTPLVYAVPDSLTFFGRYTFEGGPLDKLAIGAGFVQNWGPIYVDSPATSGLANSRGYFSANAFVRYPVKIYRHSVTVQAGVNNITNDRYMMNGGFSTPREVLLSAETRF